jgi:hypothetical protein
VISNLFFRLRDFLQGLSDWAERKAFRFHKYSTRGGRPASVLEIGKALRTLYPLEAVERLAAREHPLFKPVSRGEQ